MPEYTHNAERTPAANTAKLINTYFSLVSVSNNFFIKDEIWGSIGMIITKMMPFYYLKLERYFHLQILLIMFSKSSELIYRPHLIIAFE